MVYHRKTQFAGSGSGSGIPIGGTTSQVLAKSSNTDYDVNWYDTHYIPAGGTTNQILVKDSNTDYDVSWTTISSLLLGPFTNNAIIVADSTSTITSLSTLGTSTQVLHGNASGIPSWGAVDLSTDVTNNLPVTNLDNGTNASATTFWCGNGSWQATGGGGPQPNMAHNSEFRYYIPGVHSTVTFDSSSVTFSEHAPRWYGWADNTGFESSILDPIGIRLEKVNPARNTPIIMFQVFDNDDSVKFRGKYVTVSAVLKKGSGNTTLDTCKLGIGMGEGTNETLFDYFDVGWTNCVDYFGSELATSMTDSYQVFSETWYVDTTITQLFISILVQWTGIEIDLNPYIDIKGIYLVEGTTARDIDTKSMAVVQHECCRYKRVVDLYLRDSYESHLIDMRDIPVITTSPSITTTGTTKDSLIIKVDSSSDNGVHEITLDCELIT